MIEKSVNNAMEFATVFNLYLGGEVGGDHVDVIKAANELAQSLSDVLIFCDCPALGLLPGSRLSVRRSADFLNFPIDKSAFFRYY